MKKNYILIVIVLIVLNLMLGACTKAASKVTVATDATFPPFEIVDEATKELTGFDVELMNAIAEKAGIEIEYQNLPFDSMMAGLAECQYDMAIAAITITPEREENMLFSDPYINAGQIVVVHADEMEITGKDSLAGKIVAAQLGTTGEIEAQNIPDVTYKPYDTYDLALLDLANGQVDAVIADYPTALAFIGQNPDDLKAVGEVFTDENYGIAFCIDKTDLQVKVNQALNELIDEGLVATLEQKWLASVE
ncbi:MAG TPA: basic amino acid ABC transporter substrate-binding protein [Anaerolineae bacterium]|nr:basic amino acid ABC transporter substrate-binding protein [Anaerolineae bacterium]